LYGAIKNEFAITLGALRFVAADFPCYSDEVYANSVFSSTDFPSPPQFTSVLALDVQKHINPALVHCLYGMSKVGGAARTQRNPLFEKRTFTKL